jgi:hypothetical protein
VSANVDLVRSIYAEWERGDYASANWADPEIEFVHADAPARASWRGLDGLAEGTGAWINVWEGMRAHALAYRDIDHERVLVLNRYSGRAKTSGLEIASIGAEGASVFHLRAGKVTRIEQ